MKNQVKNYAVSGFAPTVEEMQAKIEDKIRSLVAMGKSRKEAEALMNRALELVKQGKKSINDIIN